LAILQKGKTVYLRHPVRGDLKEFLSLACLGAGGDWEAAKRDSPHGLAAR
jgi:hypothetical protein